MGMAAMDAPVLSIAAASALARIDPGRAVEVLMPHISTRRDWPRTRVASILNDLGPELVSEPLSKAALKAPPVHAARLIRYLESTHSISARPVIRRMLKRTGDDEVRAACLFVLGKFANPRRPRHGPSIPHSPKLGGEAPGGHRHRRHRNKG